MRELKFRAWDTQYDQWAYITLDHIVSGDVQDIISRCIKWCQNTGLKDKNGVEIYEGDVLTSASKKHPSDNYEVIWLDEEDESGSFFGWYCQQNGNPRIRFTLTHKPAHSSMVIGNIHENPELLNV